MNKGFTKNITICLLLLTLTIFLTGCKGNKPSSGKEDILPTSAAETAASSNGTSESQSSKEDTAAAEDQEWPAGSVTFSSSHDYSEFLKLYLELPEGVAASDLTELSFTIDNEAALELRLYAGADDVQRNRLHELTGETVEAEAVSEGTEQKEVDGKAIEQENYSLNLTKKDVTRFYLSEGKGQNLVFQVDDRASGVLQTIEGNVAVIGFYANNTAPQFTIYNVSYTAKGTKYTVTLNENSVKPTQRGYLQFN